MYIIRQTVISFTDSAAMVVISSAKGKKDRTAVSAEFHTDGVHLLKKLVLLTS